MANLIDKTFYKTLHTISDSRKDDAIDQLIPAVDQLIFNYLGRDIINHFSVGNEKVEFFDGSDYEFFVSVWPLVEIDSVEIKDIVTDNSYGTTLTEFEDYIVDINNDRVFSVSGKDFFSTPFPLAMKFTYRGGYDPNNVPSDIKMAAVRLVEFYLEEQYRPEKQLGTDSLNNQEVPMSTMNLPSDVRRLLNPYRTP